jgi:cytochrome c-type biogenesis protein CcmH/NrfG
MGLDYFFLQKYSLAEEAFQNSIQINPNEDEAFTMLGATYIKMERLSDALTACKRAVQLNPKDVGAHMNLGVVYVLLNDKFAARKQYEILKDLNEVEALRLDRFIKSK